MTTASDTIDQIRLNYRHAKAAERARIRMDLGLIAYARVYLTGWRPDADAAERKRHADQARRVIEMLRKGKQPTPADAPLYGLMAGMVMDADPGREAFEKRRKQHQRAAEKLVETLPGWARIKHVRGFSAWGLAVVIGEAGDIGAYSGCRKLFKRLGLAPDECYERGEKSEGRKIPRNTRGRVMGIIADPLLRAQWRGARDDDGEASQVKTESQQSNDRSAVVPAHAIGPFGAVYGEAKARALATGKPKAHADKLARRAMVEALLHDVHHAWHELALDYAAERPPLRVVSAA